jgi:dTDP-4-amino-4,6-dideoxygalactose transaminase
MSEKTTIAGARPTFPEDDIPGILAEIGEVLRGGRLILGPKAKALEEAAAARIGVQHAIAVSSCTAALEIAYRHVGAKQGKGGLAGKEILVPTNTFVATINAIVAAGAKPVFVDMDEADFGVDADDALSKISDRTAAAVVVHIAGIIGQGSLDLLAACRSRGIPTIEDCAHAHGASCEVGGVRREAGALADIGCFSFYPTKVLTCGVGGMITTNDGELATFARSLRHHGQGASLESIVLPGNDWVMDEVRAVIARSQLARLDDFLERRRGVAARYDAIFGARADVRIARIPAAGRPAWYKYPVILPEGTDRDRVRARLMDEEKIEAGALYWPPAHLMPVFRDSLGTKPGSLPRAERTLARQICPPMHAGVSIEDAERSAAALLRILGG